MPLIEKRFGRAGDHGVGHDCVQYASVAVVVGWKEAPTEVEGKLAASLNLWLPLASFLAESTLGGPNPHEVHYGGEAQRDPSYPSDVSPLSLTIVRACRLSLVIILFRTVQ